MFFEIETFIANMNFICPHLIVNSNSAASDAIVGWNKIGCEVEK